jgi:hypothetical protein
MPTSDAQRPKPSNTHDEDAGAREESGTPAEDPKAGAGVGVGTTTVLAAVAGMYAKGHEGELYGTDLGWTFKHEGRLWVLFGDAWRMSDSVPGMMADDAFAQISLDDYPTGTSVEAWTRAHPAPAGEPAWRAAGPTLDLALTNGPKSAFAPTTVWRDRSQLNTGPMLTPMAAFSNAREGSAAAAFGVFFRYAHVACNAGACGEGWECDRDLGRAVLEIYSPPCLTGGASAACVRGPGFCQDRSSSMYDASSESGRSKSVVVRQEVGSAVSSNPTRFESIAWDTHRFFNVAARTVKNFDPARAHGEGNDYETADGSTPEHDGVFLWGRPHFAGIGSTGHSAALYFAWAPMPVRDASGRFEWRPRYFAGLDVEGKPRFVEREVDSVPLDLDAATSGEQPEEEHDVVGQMSVAWLPSLQRWVMFYGGDIAEAFFADIFRSDAPKIRHDPRGALHVRFAEQPWGPWTSPLPLLNAGDSARDAEPVDQYAPGGVLRHNRCQSSSCAGNDPPQEDNNGVLYGSSIIEPWTVAREHEADVYWFFSTWNPYQVVLAKTTLTAH